MQSCGKNKVIDYSKDAAEVKEEILGMIHQNKFKSMHHGSSSIRDASAAVDCEKAYPLEDQLILLDLKQQPNCIQEVLEEEEKVPAFDSQPIQVAFATANEH